MAEVGEAVIRYRIDFGDLEPALKRIEGAVKELKASLDGFTKSLSRSFKTASKEISSSSKSIEKSANDVAKGINNAAVKSKKGIDSFSKYLREVDMNLLGVGFFGMMIERGFGRVLRAGVDTFLSISAGTSLANVQLARFNAELNFAKFLFGEAAMSIINWLLPAVTSVLQWFNELDPTTRKVIVAFTTFGFTVGALLSVVGFALIGIQSTLSVIEGLVPLAFSTGLVGQFRNIISGIFSVFSSLINLDFVGAEKNILKMFRTIPLLRFAGWLAIALIGFKLLKDAFKKSTDTSNKWAEQFGVNVDDVKVAFSNLTFVMWQMAIVTVKVILSAFKFLAKTLINILQSIPNTVYNLTIAPILNAIRALGDKETKSMVDQVKSQLEKSFVGRALGLSSEDPNKQLKQIAKDAVQFGEEFMAAGGDFWADLYKKGLLKGTVWEEQIEKKLISQGYIKKKEAGGMSKLDYITKNVILPSMESGNTSKIASMIKEIQAKSSLPPEIYNVPPPGEGNLSGGTTINNNVIVIDSSEPDVSSALKDLKEGNVNADEYVSLISKYLNTTGGSNSG